MWSGGRAAVFIAVKIPAEHLVRGRHPMIWLLHNRWTNLLHENYHGLFQAAATVEVQLELIQACLVPILFNIAGNFFDGAMIGQPVAVGTYRVFTRDFREINPETHTDFRRFGSAATVVGPRRGGGRKNWGANWVRPRL